jgi:hypothetical protein
MTALAIFSTPNTVGFSAPRGLAVASVSVTSVSFGYVPVGTTSAAHTVILQNTGTAPFIINSLTITGTYASSFAQTDNCGTTVAVGANCTISLTFTPKTTGLRIATLSISDSAWNGHKNVCLSGTGVAAAITLSPTGLSLGSQPVGTTSGAQTATLSNTGNGALSISSLALTGANAGDFAQTNTCGSSVAAGANCKISVTFKPSASGNRTASVSIADNATSGRQTVSLSGTGTAPEDGLTPTSLSFGSQPVGTTGGPQTATLSNGGNGAMNISSLTLTGANAGDFAQTNTCGSSLAVGASCTISVTFKPSASGNRTASVSITDNAPGSPQAVSLSGTGTAPATSLSATSLTFASQSVSTTSAAQTVTLSNTGGAALSITSLAITGTNAGDFAQTNTCGSSVAAGASCTISVTFTPTASGSRTASVSITDNVPGSPQTVSLSGTGTSGGVSLSPTSLSFGSQSIATTSAAQTVTLTNGGATTLSITSLAITGANSADFAEIADTCGSSVAAGRNCTIGVTFTPSLASAETASVSITDNASNSPQTASLSGTGSHDVILSWTASTTSGVVGYNVYRGTTSGGESSTPLNSTPISGTTYTDESLVAGTTYYYVVTAVGSNDVQSADSGETEATVPSP